MGRHPGARRGRRPKYTGRQEMGIVKLNDLIMEEAPEAVTPRSAESYGGKVLAIDASILIHQLRSAVPPLPNRDGKETGVLFGLFQRTVFLLQHRIKPLYVFDGSPPKNKRRKVNTGGQVPSGRRLPSASAPGGWVTPGSEKFKDLKTLLGYLGVPYVQAPSEAEATCAHLVIQNLAWGAVTEDMDALPFNCSRLIRNLKGQNKEEVKEYNLQEILERLKLSREQFVDLCILLGCDYTGKIQGLGRKKALKMIQTHKTIEGILQFVNEDRIPPDFDYVTARSQFLNPEVKDVNPEDVKWTELNKEKVCQFLSKENYIKESRVLRVLEKLQPPATKEIRKRKSKTTEASPGKQMRIRSYFRVKKSANQSKTAPHQDSSTDGRPEA